MMNEDGVIVNTPGAWSQRARIATTSWDAAMWSEAGQRERFQSILEYIAPKYEPGNSLLDYGCGTGSFSGLVSESLMDCRYTGYDYASAMIKRAREECKESPTRRFWNTEPAGRFDFVVVCGTFNLKHMWSKQQTNTMLSRLILRTKKMLIGSFYMGDDEQCITYDPNDFLSFVPEPRFAYIRANDLLVTFDIGKGVGGS